LKKLSKEAQKWHDTLQTAYSIFDAGGMLLLRTAAECFDRLRQFQKIVDKDGLVQTDKAGQLKSHPLLIEERNARAQMMAAIKALNLDLEPVKTPGRPTQPKCWNGVD
jgi:hypothetical protein